MAESDGSWADDLDPALMGRVVEASIADCDELHEERNVLGVALRKIHAEIDPPDKVLWPGYEGRVLDIAGDALEQVFTGDPLGEKGEYACPTADGRDVMGEKLGGEA